MPVTCAPHAPPTDPRGQPFGPAASLVSPPGKAPIWQSCTEANTTPYIEANTARAEIFGISAHLRQRPAHPRQRPAHSLPFLPSRHLSITRFAQPAPGEAAPHGECTVTPPTGPLLPVLKILGVFQPVLTHTGLWRLTSCRFEWPEQGGD